MEREQWGLLRTCLDVAGCPGRISNLVPKGYAEPLLQEARAQGPQTQELGGAKGALAQAFLITWYLASPYPSEDMLKEQGLIAMKMTPKVTGKYPTATFAAWIRGQKHAIALGVS